jgi:hypothetical protein
MTAARVYTTLDLWLNEYVLCHCEVSGVHLPAEPELGLADGFEDIEVDNVLQAWFIPPTLDEKHCRFKIGLDKFYEKLGTLRGTKQSEYEASMKTLRDDLAAENFKQIAEALGEALS